jgi:two-component system sensor histidine kinase ChiS
MYIIYGNVDLNNTNKSNPVAKKGVIDLRHWDFNQDGIIKLQGEWEFYKNKLLTPEDFKGTSLEKAYSSIPGSLGGPIYGTYRLKILVNSEESLYSLKMNYVQNAFKLWANDKQVLSLGQVGKSKSEMIPKIIPKTDSFYLENGEVYLILQVSSFYSISGYIDDILMGTDSVIDNYNFKKQALDLFLFGGTMLAALYSLALFSTRKKDKAPLYFAVLCIIVSIRIIFLGERFFISLFPSFDYTLSVKIMIWTYYLYIPFIVLFIDRYYGGFLEKKVVQVSNFLGVLYFFIVLIIPTQYYSLIIFPFEIFTLLMILYIMWKIYKVYIEAKTNDYIIIVGVYVLFLTRLNDILYEYSIIITGSFAPLGVFVFIITSYYVLAERMSKALSNSEEISEKLKSLNSLKDDFLAITSHELKTPLNGIIGLTESLETRTSGNLSEDEKDDLFLIKKSAIRLSNLVNDIVILSKLKNNEMNLELKPVNINKLLKTVIRFCEPFKGNKRVEIVNLIDSKVPYVYGDEDRIQQIFYNLLGNAIKFTHEGKIIVSCAVKKNYLEISIEDNGIGISKDRINRIFHIYEQGEGISEKYGGTGLGLYITKNLVKLHNGEITVTSIEGKGSKFSFTLQLSSVANSLEEDKIKDIEYNESLLLTNETHKETVEDINISDNKKYKILIVDDEYVNQRVLEHYLSHFNCKVLKASTGKQALDLIDKNEDLDLDLVILDMMIPDLLGYEVLSKIRKKYSLIELPVLMVTADSRLENLELSFKNGANDYLRKPFNKQELLSRVNTLLTLKDSVEEALLLVQEVTTANKKVESLSIKNDESNKKVAELIEYDKVKTEFFANISHELKTPLNVICSTVQLLRSLDESKTLGDERIKYYFSIMNQNALRLLRLINNIIDTTKIDGSYLNMNFKNGNIVSVIEDLVQSVADFIESKGINIIFDTEVEEKIIAFDEEKLERIILNLLSNAVKFTGVKGSIYVNIYDKGDSVEISVRDTGIGIPEDKLEFIFERFAQVDKSLKRKREGSGIGLSLVKSLVKIHGGSICVKSKLAQGSEFTVSLPVKTLDAEECENSTAHREIPPAKYEEKLKVEFSDIYL